MRPLLTSLFIAKRFGSGQPLISQLEEGDVGEEELLPAPYSAVSPVTITTADGEVTLVWHLNLDPQKVVGMVCEGVCRSQFT
jgi:hypothetical protein